MMAIGVVTAHRAITCAALFACALPCLAQTTATCDQTLTATLQPRSSLRIESRPAGLEIVATDEQAIHITCKSGHDDLDLDQIELRFDPTSDGGKLTIHGPRRRENNLHIKIQVPRKTNLSVSMFAGEVKVEEITGEKSIDLYAGQITISSEHDWNYRTVDASVTIGEVRAPIYDAEKGGFFRNISKKNPGGEYRLRAHVKTGEIDLLGKKISSDAARRPD